MIGQEIQKQLTGLSHSQEIITLSPSKYEDVELTEDEIEEALRKGREAKHFNLARIEYREKLIQATTQYKPNARELYERLCNTKSNTGDRFEVTPWNRHVVFGLCLYFAEDPKFEADNYGSLKKGIMLRGPQGVGKTHLMNFFAVNPYQSYRSITTKMIAEQYAQKWERDGFDALRYYGFSHKAPFDYAYGQEKLGFCFGDLGTENLRKQYGNETNVMEHVIFQRYENQTPFHETHFTTNLDSTEIEETYGVRVRDRLKEMCNLFTLDGPSWRK